MRRLSQLDETPKARVRVARSSQSNGKVGSSTSAWLSSNRNEEEEDSD